MLTDGTQVVLPLAGVVDLEGAEVLVPVLDVAELGDPQGERVAARLQGQAQGEAHHHAVARAQLGKPVAVSGRARAEDEVGEAV